MEQKCIYNTETLIKILKAFKYLRNLNLNFLNRNLNILEILAGVC